MKFERLGSIAKNLDNKRVPLNSVQRESKSKKELYPYIGANNIMGYIDEYIFDEKILCIAEDGGSWGAGQICTNIYNEKCWVNNHAHVLVENGKAKLEYLRYFLNQADLTKYITGSTRGKLTKSALESILVPLPSVQTQIHIANILTKAENLISQRKESIRLLDEYLKSMFLEMFGDPTRNERKWEVKRLNLITKVGTGGTPSRLRESEFYGGNIFWAKTTEVNGSYIIDTEEKITELALKESNCKIYPIGTILLAMYGQGKTRGNVGLLKIPAATNQACAAIPQSEILNQVFLFELLKNSYEYLRSLARGGNQENLNLSIVGNIHVILPPLELQTQFAQIVEKIEVLKTQYQQSLQELENLYGSLSQRAFSPAEGFAEAVRGELTIKDEEDLRIAAEPKAEYKKSL